MNKLKTMDRTVRGNYLTYAFVIAAFVILSLLTRNPSFSPTLRGQLVPICAYVVREVMT